MKFYVNLIELYCIMPGINYFCKKDRLYGTSFYDSKNGF